MRVLGIETTCDETAAAVVADGWNVLSNAVLSQVPLHERFGGVVPEIASRAHVESLTRIIERALVDAGLSWPKPGEAPPVDAIAVAHRPGLVGSLLVGLSAAKSLALAWDLPLVGVDHIHAHIYAAFLSVRDPRPPPAAAEIFPAVSLVVSGGHTSLYKSTSWTEHELIGATTDDAAGEAFDKTAAVLGLGYPGGPAISRAAEGGDPQAVRFPRTLLGEDSLDFSFSGLKTAVLYHVKGQNARRSDPAISPTALADVAASFEEAVTDVLVEKLRRAAAREKVRSVVVGGGVAANRRLRRRLEAFACETGLRVWIPEPALSTDNAAMIAGLGYRLLERGDRAEFDLDADPRPTRSGGESR